MPGLSKVIVLDPDARARRQVQLGFEREGIPAAAAEGETEAEIDAGLGVPGDDTGLVLVGGADGHGVERIRRARGWLAGRGIDAPVVFAGRGVEPREATAAGADEVVRHPAYLRDVVTIGRLLCGRPADQRDHVVGNLIELTGVFTLVRALSALGRSATLTLVRGLRRGEVRFYFGEVTSAQVGLIHGQAALHQLLLWTDARFDFHHEDVVRRQQIPMSRDELFADAERFLEGVRDSSGGLSPAMVLEQDLPRVQSLAKQIPTEVYGVLRMFDGHRTLADVLEDSPYRVFETLRVAQRAVEAGLIRVVDRPPPRPGWRTLLALEDWLVGGDPRETIAVNDARPATIRDARGAPAPPGPPAGKAARKRRKKKRRTDTPPAVPIRAAPRDIDWGALVPRIVGAEVGPLAGVVPASHVSGEIVMTAARASASAAGNAAARDAPVADAEPTIVFDEAAVLARDAEAERADAERAAEARRAAAEAEHAAAAALAHAEAERIATERAEAEARARAAADAERAEADRVAAERAEAEARARAAADAERAEAERADAERVEAKRSDADARAEAIRTVAATVSVSSEPARVVEALPLADTKPERPGAAARAAQATAGGVAAAPAAETPAADPAIVEDSGVAPSDAITAPMAAVSPPPDVAAPGDAVVDVPAALAPTTDPTPTEVVDEPSDGVVRHHIATAETAPVKRRHAPPDPRDDDRPGDTTGEITMPRQRPPIVIRYSEPTILVPDLAAIQAELSERSTIPTAQVARSAATTNPATSSPATPNPATASAANPSAANPNADTSSPAAPNPATASAANPSSAASSLTAFSPAASNPATASAANPSAANPGAVNPNADTSSPNPTTASAATPNPATASAATSSPAATPSTSASNPAASSPSASNPAASSPTASSPATSNTAASNTATSSAATSSATDRRAGNPNPATASAATPSAAARSATTSSPAAANPAPPSTSTPRTSSPARAAGRDSAPFNAIEEAFFQAGHDKAAHAETESFDDLDEGYRPIGFWERLTGRGKPDRQAKPEQPDQPHKPDPRDKPNRPDKRGKSDR